MFSIPSIATLPNTARLKQYLKNPVSRGMMGKVTIRRAASYVLIQRT
jgi:hypothetical protein